MLVPECYPHVPNLSVCQVTNSGLTQCIGILDEILLHGVLRIGCHVGMRMFGRDMAERRGKGAGRTACASQALQA